MKSTLENIVGRRPESEIGENLFYTCLIFKTFIQADWGMICWFREYDNPEMEVVSVCIVPERHFLFWNRYNVMIIYRIKAKSS